jgi:hypothetical protein
MPTPARERPEAPSIVLDATAFDVVKAAWNSRRRPGLASDFSLSHDDGIEPAGDQEQVLDRALAHMDDEGWINFGHVRFGQAGDHCPSALDRCVELCGVHVHLEAIARCEQDHAVNRWMRRHEHGGEVASACTKRGQLSAPDGAVADA